MEEYKRPKSRLASQRRRFEPLDMSKSSSSLNVSTSSLRSNGEKTRKDEVAVQVSRRTTTTVRFAPPPKSSSLVESAKSITSSLVSGQQALARPATASGPRPGSSAGPRCRTSAGTLSESRRPKTMRRSWGLAGVMDATEERRNGPSAPKTQQLRSSSAPRRILPPEEKEKPSPKRGSKIMMTTSRAKNPAESPLKPDKAGGRSPPNIAKKTGDDQKVPVPLNNTTKVSPPSRITVAMIGASWDSLPSDVQSLGLEVMRYRDGAEAAAIAALHEASAAEILLRCLSAFAELTSAAAEQSPQQTVDEFLALHAALTTISTAAARSDNNKQQGGPAGDWLRAAITTDLAPFSVYSATRQSSRTSSPEAAYQSPPLTRRPPPAMAGGAGAEEAWVYVARRVLGEEMRAWFLGHVERLLDGDVAGTLGQLKRVSDWLDAVGIGSEQSLEAAVERVRKKIYGFLLDHVESAVVALNGGAAAGRRK